MADDNSTFLRFTVTSGSLGTGQVWVAGPSDAGAVGKVIERLLATVLALVSRAAGGFA